MDASSMVLAKLDAGSSCGRMVSWGTDPEFRSLSSGVCGLNVSTSKAYEFPKGSYSNAVCVSIGLGWGLRLEVYKALSGCQFHWSMDHTLSTKGMRIYVWRPYVCRLEILKIMFVTSTHLESKFFISARTRRWYVGFENQSTDSWKKVQRTEQKGSNFPQRTCWGYPQKPDRAPCPKIRAERQSRKIGHTQDPSQGFRATRGLNLVQGQGQQFGLDCQGNCTGNLAPSHWHFFLLVCKNTSLVCWEYYIR